MENDQALAEDLIDAFGVRRGIVGVIGLGYVGLPLAPGIF